MRLTIGDDENNALVTVHPFDRPEYLPGARTRKYISSHTGIQQTLTHEPNCTRFMTGATAANQRDFGRIVVRSVNYLERGDEGEVRVCSYQSFQGTEDECGVIVEDMSISHCGTQCLTGLTR